MAGRNGETPSPAGTIPRSLKVAAHPCFPVLVSQERAQVPWVPWQPCGGSHCFCLADKEGEQLRPAVGQVEPCFVLGSFLTTVLSPRVLLRPLLAWPICGCQATGFCGQASLENRPGFSFFLCLGIAQHPEVLQWIRG